MIKSSHPIPYCNALLMCLNCCLYPRNVRHFSITNPLEFCAALQFWHITAIFSLSLTSLTTHHSCLRIPVPCAKSEQIHLYLVVKMQTCATWMSHTYKNKLLQETEQGISLMYEQHCGNTSCDAFWRYTLPSASFAVAHYRAIKRQNASLLVLPQCCSQWLKY